MGLTAKTAGLTLFIFNHKHSWSLSGISSAGFKPKRRVRRNPTGMPSRLHFFFFFARCMDVSWLPVVRISLLVFIWAGQNETSPPRQGRPASSLHRWACWGHPEPEAPSWVCRLKRTSPPQSLARRTKHWWSLSTNQEESHLHDTQTGTRALQQSISIHD